jgi:hypothetical protein
VEFLSLNYLKELKKQGYLNHLLSQKKVLKIKKYNLEFDKIRIKKHTIAIVIVYYHCYCGQKMEIITHLKF